jgi:hypothetical protein
MEEVIGSTSRETIFSTFLSTKDRSPDWDSSTTTTTTTTKPIDFYWSEQLCV